MIDVAPSVSLDQRLDCPHDPAQFNLTPTITNQTYPQTFDLNQTPFCIFDFSDEQFFDSDIHQLFAMFQQTPQVQSQQQSDLPHSQLHLPHQRQFNEMPYQHQYSPVEAQQTIPSPPFVEPSVNYFEIPAPFFTSLMTSHPTLSSSPVNGSVDSRGYMNSVGVVTIAAQQNYQPHESHHPSSRSSQLLADNFRLTQENPNYNNYNNVPGHPYFSQRLIYSGEISSLRQHPSNHYHRKQVPVINTSLPPSPVDSFSRPSSTASSPVNSSIAQQLLTPTITQVLNATNNDNGHDESTMHLPIVDLADGHNNYNSSEYVGLFVSGDRVTNNAN
ncbi:4235_t:CDS:2, partial [Acaulospora colombiana]